MSEQGELIIKAVREAAIARPLHFVQGECAYVKNGAPSCLVGHALWDLGLIDANFEDSRDNVIDIAALLSQLHIKVDHEEIDWLEVAQTAQDNHLTWGETIRQADNFRREDLW